jgi:hypothetical protein
LEDSDAAELFAVCKGEIDCKPLEAAHVKATSAGNPVVILRRLRDVQHVNALAADETLSFTRAGLTVVYGDNGSGKSGYARILKQVCRARVGNKSENVLPNIYDANPGAPSGTTRSSVRTTSNVYLRACSKCGVWRRTATGHERHFGAFA